MTMNLALAKRMIAARDEEIEELRKDREWWAAKRLRIEEMYDELHDAKKDVEYWKARAEAAESKLSRLGATQ